MSAPGWLGPLVDLLERLLGEVKGLREDLVAARRTTATAPAGTQLLPAMRPMPPPKLVALPGGPAVANGDAPPLESLLDVKQAARFLGMSADWVYRAAEQGRIPYRKLGSRLRFVPEELQAWATGKARPA